MTAPLLAPAIPTWFGPQAPEAQATTKKTLSGRDDFLKLFIAQLENQDPMSPLQPHELAAQLAQFTSVEQLANLNEAVLRQTEANAMATLSAQANLGASVLGREVLGLGTEVVVTRGEPAQVTIDIAGAGGSAVVQLLDRNGRPFLTRDLGPVDGGRRTLTLPADLPEGTWRYAVAVTDASGRALPVRTFVRGVVDGVTFDGGALALRVGGAVLPIDRLVEIAPARTR